MVRARPETIFQFYGTMESPNPDSREKTPDVGRPFGAGDISPSFHRKVEEARQNSNEGVPWASDTNQRTISRGIAGNFLTCNREHQ